MFSTRFFAPALAVMAFSMPANAQVPLGGMVTGNDFDRIVEIASAYGPAERQSSDEGHWVRAEMDGTIYTISFHNCDDQDWNCSSVQFRAWWESNGSHTVGSMNQWNRDRRFSAAYLDARDNATIEFDVNLAGGVTAVNFDDTLQWWREVLSQFKDMVIEPGYAGQPYTGAPDMPPAVSK
jgi:hypothetical protein